MQLTQNIALPRLKTDNSPLSKIKIHHKKEKDFPFERYHSEFSTFQGGNQKHLINQFYQDYKSFELKRKSNRHSLLITHEKHVYFSRQKKTATNKEQLHKIIDTKKSIKILVDFFQARRKEHNQSQQKTDCYSPRKRPINLVSIRQAGIDYHSVRKSLFKKARHTTHEKSCNESKLLKKEKALKIECSLNVQNLMLRKNILEQISRKPRQLNLVPTNSSVPQISKIKQRKGAKGKLSGTNTQIGGWKTNIPECQLLQ